MFREPELNYIPLTDEDRRGDLAMIEDNQTWERRAADAISTNRPLLDAHVAC